MEKLNKAIQNEIQDLKDFCCITDEPVIYDEGGYWVVFIQYVDPTDSGCFLGDVPTGEVSEIHVNKDTGEVTRIS